MDCDSESSTSIPKSSTPSSSKVTPEQQQRYNETRRKKRAAETPEQREKRLEKDRNYRKRNRSSSSSQLLHAPALEHDPSQSRREHVSLFIGRRNAKEVQEFSVGSYDKVCEYCQAVHFGAEATTRQNFSTSCRNGTIKLEPLLPYPEIFRRWICGSDATSKHFRENIRKYNNAFAFSSLGYQPVKFNRGIQAFVIHGQAYHCTATSVINNENNPKYAQLYFLDPEFANNARLQHPQNSRCTKEIMGAIDAYIRENNPYADAFKMMKDVVAKTGRHDIEMHIIKDLKYDQRRYNPPIEKNEVAAVFTSDDGLPQFERDICIHLKGSDRLQQINILNPNCDPMTYPLLFPNGQQGWQPYMKSLAKPDISVEKDSSGINPDTSNQPGTSTTTSSKQPEPITVSMQKYYSYRLQERQIFNPLLHSAKLTQQFIVDSYLKFEGNNLNYYRYHQTDLRVESYLGLMDFVNNQADAQNLKPGKVLILPSSFNGSKRAMQQDYQDAMTMVAVFGKPDLFITFTCNPNWKEIQENLRRNEHLVDRPDLVATVFHLKLNEFMNDMMKKHVLGKIKAFQSVIEFQKRGLPHCHMLFILEAEDKLREPEEIDTTVSAEIPDLNEDPILHQIVLKCMLHGPCGDLNLTSPCMENKDGKPYCTKGFPKTFSECTQMHDDGYPVYRRRKNGTVTKKGDCELDNSWVVPYNPYLCKKYNAHINVEVCSTVKSVKYIFKYIYKGHDAAVIRVNEQGEPSTYNWDEIQTYIDTRYISPPEAMWRTREYKMQDRSHPIYRLAVHLPFQQTVVLQNKHSSSEELAKKLRDAARKGTTLTSWFELNRDDRNARKYLYSEIPHHYVYENNKWKIRKRGKVLPRMYSVSPKDPERYSLRLLLLHIKGAQSFVDLRTVNNVVHGTFKEAAMAMNLLETDDHWINTLDEAVVFQMPSQLRVLFAMILLLGEPADPRILYAKYKNHLAEDFEHIHQKARAENSCLLALEEHLQQGGKSCTYFGLPSPEIDDQFVQQDTHLQIYKDESETLRSKLNPEQLDAFHEIMNSVNGVSSCKNFFISGAGGCGKTFLYQTLITTLLGRGDKVKVVAPTGLAATLLKNGQTIHSGFGMPLKITEESRSNIKQGSESWKLLRDTKLIIWDEISMCKKSMFIAVDESLRDLLNKPNEPFGGITVVVGGDFRQQTPVLRHSNRVRVIEECVKRAPTWKIFKEVRLQTNMRVNSNEVDFMNWLLKIGSGLTEENVRSDFVCIPKTILSSDIISSVFGEDLQTMPTEHLSQRAILCPKNEDTIRLNNIILEKLKGDSHTYLSVDSIMDCESEEERDNYPMEFLNSLTPMGMPQHILKLKKGCCVMLLRNLNAKLGLCNGTRLIVQNLGQNLIDCSILIGDYKGYKVLIPRLALDSDDGDMPFKLRRKQFPLRLAYSMTITKSQGQTFEKIGIFLPQPVFSHGQLYTALSRVKSRDGLAIQINQGNNQGVIFKNDENTYTYNCVYLEILGTFC